jgi:O-antigen ligase
MSALVPASSRSAKAASLVLGAVVAVLLAAVIVRLVAHGTAFKDTAIAILLLAPVGIYFSFVRPLVFPYGLYILLTPFDMFLEVSKAGTLTKLTGIVTGLLLLFYCLRTRRIVVPGTALRVLAAFVLWAAASVLWSINPAFSNVPLQTLLGLVILYAALALTPVSFTDFKFILGAIIIAFATVAILGIFSFHELAPSQGTAGQRLFLAFGSHYIDPNEYGDALVFPIAIVTMFTLRTRAVSLKLLGIFVLCMMGAALALSASREATLALLVVLFYYLWRSRYRLQLLGILGAMILAMLPSFPRITGRFQDAFSTGGAGRTSIWAVGIQAVKHFGIFGSGIGTFPEAYNRFYLSTPQTYLYGWSAPPHNVLLQYWVELGIVGLALIVWFVIASFVMLRVIPRDHPLYDYRIMVEAGLIGLCVTAIFIDSSNAKWAWMIFATAAQLAYLASTYRRIEAPPTA